MGLSKKKTKTVQTNDPWAPAQPFILKNLQQQDDVFNATQPQLANYAAMQRDTYGRLAPGAETGIASAQSLVNRNLAGDNLNGNPYVDAILEKTRGNVSDSVGGAFSSAGRYGSGYHADILARALADAENEARFGNYNMERGYQQQAIGDSQALMGGAQSLLNNAAELPWIGVQAANGAVRQASSGYGTSTSKTTQSGGLGSMLGGIVGAGLSGWAGGGFKMSDERLKANKIKIGERPDGVGLYSYVMKPTGEPQIGVLAQDVAEKRPDALGPMVGGFGSVDYGKLGMPGPLTPGGGIGGELPGMPAMPDAITTPVDMPDMGAAPAKPKFFGEGGVGRGIAGALGDVLLQQAGMAPTYGPTMQRRQEAEAEEAQWSRRREAENADWQAREQWKRDNPLPGAPNDTERDYQFYLSTVGKSAADAWLKGQTDPVVSIPLPNGDSYVGPRSGLPAAVGAVNSPPASTPRLPIGAKYGGATGNPSPTFQR